MLTITTETGSVYTVDYLNICEKRDKDNNWIDTFKVLTMKPVGDWVTNLNDLLELPNGNPEIGKRLYLGGRDTWWISTKVVSIEESNE
jgi:hypothetical protein